MEPVAKPSYEDLAGLTGHALVRPELTNSQLLEELELAKRLRVLSIAVRPCDIEVAVRMLEGSAVRPGSVAGFPHGSQSTAVKLYEVRDLLRRGAREIGMVVAVPRLVSREFQYVQTELNQAAEACHREGVVLKVILENAYLDDELKTVACRCCARAGVDFVTTSRGFAPSGCAVADVKLMRLRLPVEIGVEAAGGLRTLDQVLEIREAGAARISTSSPAPILEEWRARIATAL